MTFLYRLLTISTLLLVLSAPFSTTQAQTDSPVVKDGTPRYVTTKLVPEFNMVEAGQPLAIAIDQKMVEGWHTYWKNPGDSGEATSITWTLPAGWTSDPVSYPTPEKQPTGPLMNYGYGEHVTLLTALHPPATLSETSVSLKATITWLVCSDICVPETTDVTLDLPVAQKGQTPQETDAALFTAARAALPEQAAWQGSLEEQDQTLTLNFQVPDDIADVLKSATDITYYSEDWGVLLYASPQIPSINENVLAIQVQRDTRPLSDLSSLKGVIAFVTATGEKKSVAVDIPIASGAATTSAPTKASLTPSSPDDTSYGAALFLAFLGGLILNLMPCVFPVLSMKAMSLIKMSHAEQKHARLHGLIYTTGILVCFLSIAVVLILLQNAGAQIGWGFQLQNPAVILALAYLLFIMGLNMAGFFDLSNNRLGNIGHSLASKHGYVGTFFTGVLATIVATPCTAPFMGTAMGYAITQPHLIALSIFVALGLGLAAPYLILCFYPPLRKALPKPGAWMESFRQFMSFPLFASVVWLIWVYTLQAPFANNIIYALSGLVLIAFGIWLGKFSPQNTLWKATLRLMSVTAFLGTFGLIGLSTLTAQDDGSQSEQTTEFPSIPFSTETYENLLKGDEPLFIDMTAAWCITCKVNEKVAISSDATQKLFRAKNVQVLVGDWTNRNNEITEFLRAHGRSGVPLYVYIGPRDLSTGQRPEGVILPQLLTPGIIAEAIAN